MERHYKRGTDTKGVVPPFLCIFASFLFFFIILDIIYGGGGADLRTLFQNEGESPNLIPKTVRCEIRT